MTRYHNRTGRSRQKGQFVMLPHYLIDCAAWRSLSFPAISAFIQLARLYNGSNNGRLALAASTLAERLGCSKSTAARALNELEEKGFIGVQRMGTFRRRDRLATEYYLTHFRNDVNFEPPSRAFSHWTRDGIKSLNCGVIHEPRAI